MSVHDRMEDLYSPLGFAYDSLEEYEASKPINNIANSSERERENFLIATVKPLILTGATLDTVEEQMLEVAHHFNVKITVTRLPGEFSCIMGDYGSQRRTIKIRDSGNRIVQPFALVEVCETLAAVTNDEMRMADGVAVLAHLPEKPEPLVYPSLHAAIAATLSAYICMRAFEGWLFEVLWTFATTYLLCMLQLLVKRASSVPANFVEAVVTVLVSLFAHDAHVYANIIVGVLPGYLYFCNVTKNTTAKGSPSAEAYIRTLFYISYAISPKMGLPIMMDFILVIRLTQLVWFGKGVSENAGKPKRTSIRLSNYETPNLLQKALEAVTINQ